MKNSCKEFKFYIFGLLLPIIIFLLILNNIFFHNSKIESYSTCFTPNQKCTPLIVDAINNSKHIILVQAYSFTSAPILKALKKAHDRGVDVEVILDKGQVSKKGKYTSATFLQDAGIATYIDYKVSIAHNKVMIFDNNSVLFGSFNFTESAEKRNAENFTIFNNMPQLTTAYMNNWKSRMEQSKKLSADDVFNKAFIGPKRIFNITGISFYYLDERFQKSAFNAQYFKFFFR